MRMEIEYKQILRCVCTFYRMEYEEIFRYTRKMHIVKARQVFYYLCCKYTKKSLSSIGAIQMEYGRIKGQHHATVLHARNTVQGLLEVDKGFRNEFDELKQIIWGKYCNPEIEKIAPTDIDLLNICIRNSEALKNYIAA